MEELQNGPPLFKTNKRAYVDSVLNANNHLDWVQRLREKNAPTLQVPGQPDLSTHFMADDGNGYIYPTVIRKPGEKNLTFLGKTIKDPKTGKISYDTDMAYDYAKSTGTGIQLPAEQGTWFANNGYKTGTNVLNGIGANGIPFNNPNYIPITSH
jgi:hypothetical protein